MLLALISDIHANAVALEAALRDIEPFAPEQIVCLGDVATWGPEPRRCIELVAQAGCVTVMGNSDGWMLAPEPFVKPTALQKQNEDIDRWCLAQLEPEDLATLKAYEFTVRLAIGDGSSLLCCHGSPRSYYHPIRSDTPRGDLMQWLEDLDTDVLASGHAHVQMVRQHDAVVLVNPGSVGMPYLRTSNGRVRNPPWAEYALLKADESGLEVRLRRVRYDLAELESSTLDSGMPHAEAWLGDRW